jgi:hypothetical protein
MTEELKKEVRILMFKLYPLRLNYALERLTHKADMYSIIKKFKVSEEFLRHYIQTGAIHGYNWSPVAYNQDLSEQFMIDFQDNLDWMNISISQNLSESFMRRMKHRIFWNYASESQKMSPDFIIDFHDKINYYCLIKNKRKDMKVFPDTLIYDLSLLIDKRVFRGTFLKEGKITAQRLREIENKYMWHTRFDLLDL